MTMIMMNLNLNHQEVLWRPLCVVKKQKQNRAPSPSGVIVVRGATSDVVEQTTSTSTASASVISNNNNNNNSKLLLLSAKEKRELRMEKRDEKRLYNWREDVEEKLLQKPKKQFNSWKEELNLDKLALLGPQWWILKVSRAKGKDTVERMMQALHKNFPDTQFKVFTAAINEKNKLKSGKISIKPNPLYPGCVFLNCTLNRELHNFIKEDCQGVGGFVGRMVGNTKRQINKPRPVSQDDMKEIFQEVKEKQQASDQAFEQHHSGAALDLDKNLVTKRRSKKPSGSGPLLGSNVRIISGDFTDFSGTIKKLDKKRGLATVGFTLFGKETIADFNLSDIVQHQK